VENVSTEMRKRGKKEEDEVRTRRAKRERETGIMKNRG